MKEQDSASGVKRRDFLKTMGLAAATAAALPVLASPASATSESPQDQVKSRYRETDHVKRFYALNRL